MATSPAERKRQERRCPGPRGDERMNRALIAREANPELPLLDALLDGGFIFPGLGIEKNDKLVRDADGVTLYQRKNQLMRRQREARKRNSKTPRTKQREVKASNRTKIPHSPSSNRSSIVYDVSPSQNLADMELFREGDDVHSKFDIFEDLNFEEMVRVEPIDHFSLLLLKSVFDVLLTIFELLTFHLCFEHLTPFVRRCIRRKNKRSSAYFQRQI
uniref:Uncharacterized protein n=1 Tax=Helicotheca tamesis TaxID=374047 RepID=A0A7S2ID38_9STRA|mmetsp:Transcript_8146/g.11196  ORF Transcript_8146/g.11196 Transcript_8146/m.11196 type:complete len:216 (+) Transcript_8146:122-769(+)